MHLTCEGRQFKITGNFLEVDEDGVKLTRLPLVPWVDGKPCRAGPWRQVNGKHYSLDLPGLGQAHLAVREGHVCYWVETKRKHFKSLTYFPNSHPTKTGWHTFLSDELDRYWSLNENADVPLSSAYIDMHVDKEDGAGMTDPGDKPPTWIWNIPARAFAIETPKGWMGISIPGPLSVGVTRMTMQHGTFNLKFEEFRPTAREWGPARVYFIPGLPDPYDALDQHRRISKACGLMRTKIAKHPKWWSYPTFKCGDEIFRVNNKQWILRDEDGNFSSFLTTDNWLRWIDHVAKYTRLEGNMNLQVDQLFFHGYGGRHVISTLGGQEGFRKTIDQLRDKGFRVGLYLHLYMIDPTATDFPAKHPDAICKPKDPSFKVWHGCQVGSQSMAYVDWTHPAGRQYMLEQVAWRLSNKPDCLNADWLLLNNNLGVDPRKWTFYDPDWGTGDLMSMKATKLVYEYAKKIKPGCYVRRQSPGDPYMQPYCDQANLCEEWNGQTTAWYKRAHIATRVLDNVIFHTDAWFVTLTKLTEYYFALAAICPPENESVAHAIHPYINWRPMRSKDYGRIRAGMQTYMNAPVRKGDECRVNFKAPDELEIWRKHSAGPLAGWYAAIALHKRCFVTYSEREARVAASQERRVTVPLPPGARLHSVKAVPHEGKAYPYKYEQPAAGEEQSITLWVPDSGESVMYIQINYDLAK
ncbi:MAG: hypothetical protein V1913_15545 [Fibrobacterota bacterium]